MDDEKFEEKVLSLIAEGVPARFKKPRITAEMRLQRDLGVDSIGILALLFRFEQAFGIDLARIDLAVSVGQMKTVGDALKISRAVIERARISGTT